MPLDDSETQTGSDLAALSAAAHGRVMLPPLTAPPKQPAPTPEEITRSARVSELKAQYEAGHLSIDEKALASKLIDTMLDSTRQT